jgi:hypothetical protein
MWQSVRDAFLPFSEPLEGRVRFMYLDVKSLVSTGVGNLLDVDDPRHFGSNPHPLPDTFGLGWFDKDTGVAADQPEIESEYQTVKFSGTALEPLPRKERITRLRITDEAINRLIEGKLSSFEDTLRRRPEFADYDAWPADAQLGLLSMAWAMGPLFRFPRFQAAVAGGDWLTAAKESRMTELGNPGIVPRNVRNGLLFTFAFWNAAPPPGDLTQLVFDPTVKLPDLMRDRERVPIPLNLEIGIQTALEALGLDPRGLDGRFGPGTRFALTGFQEAHGLQRTPAANAVEDLPVETIDALVADLDAAGIGHIPI